METSARQQEAILTPRQIFDRLDQYVIGQHEAKRAVAIAAYNHLKRIETRHRRHGRLLKKSNVLLIGPTGSGKTHIARNLAEILQVPLAIVDATEFTEAGYYGKDVEVMVSELLLKANHSVHDAERGIIFIDEVDKIARRNQIGRTGAGSRDIGGEGVQQGLLKLLEGREVSVPMNAAPTWSRQEFVRVDTRDVLFICAGTFSDLFDHTSGGETRAIGFGAESVKQKHKNITLKQLIEFGMLAEFLGRLPIMVQLQPLSEDDLLRILTEPPDSITREFRDLLALDDIELEFAAEALNSVVRFAMQRGLGARGLRSVLEHVMAEIMFDGPESRARKIVVDAPLVERRLVSFMSPS